MKSYRHGEALLIQIEAMPKGKIKTSKKVIVSHSETGHHHVLESDTNIDWTEFKKNIFVNIKVDTPLVHKKTYDKHETITITPGIYKVIPKTEYDPFQQVVREVWD